VIETDVLVVGGGMAGASAAAMLAAKRRTLLIERESALGTQSTGRSAAMIYVNYGAAPVRALSRASLPYFQAPPAGFAEHPLLRRTGVLMIAAPGDEALFDDYLADADRRANAVFLSPDEAVAKVPILKRERIGSAIFEADAWDLEVDLILQGFRRQARALGAEIRTDCGLSALRREGDGWIASTPAGEIRTRIVVDAAGAWADEVAALAGLPPLRIQPKRRTALTVPVPPGIDTRGWPMTVDVRERFYFKPDAGAILMSLADETDSPPCDAWPRDEDVAEAVERVQQHAELPVAKLISSWAGLRCFAPDRIPVNGVDPLAHGFYWLAGQGGYGIQTAPAMAMLCAALVAGEPVPAALSACGVRAEDLAPARLR
jgi:D-arginine dehydrogenase